MTALAIGVGCRKNCASAAIVALIERALAGRDRVGARLFTLDRKAGEPNLQEAARLVGLPLFSLPVTALSAVTSGLTVRSERVTAAVGVPSVAEAAALAGAGTGSRLLVPRMAEGGATCAVAVGTGDSA